MTTLTLICIDARYHFAVAMITARYRIVEACYAFAYAVEDLVGR